MTWPTSPVPVVAGRVSTPSRIDWLLSVVATAILERLLHHSHVMTIRGDSYRLRTKRRAGLVKQASATAETTAN